MRWKVPTRVVGTAALVVAAGICFGMGMSLRGAEAKARAMLDRPDVVNLAARIRDFRGKGEAGGHPDFGASLDEVRVGLLEEKLGEHGRPVIRDLAGQSMPERYTTLGGVGILPSLADVSRGDVMGRLESAKDRVLTSRASFQQWYSDTPGVNRSLPATVQLWWDPTVARFVFDTRLDEKYQARGGFLPIDGQLLGNVGSTGRNYFFTTEIVAEFEFHAGRGQAFTITSDDCAWVYVDGRLAVDLGGTRSGKDQKVPMDRMGLKDGKTYEMRIFLAQRQVAWTHLRLESTFPLESRDLMRGGAQK